MSSKIRPDNYVSIPGWACTELGLKGNDLIIYSIIYGFSQTSGQCFSGSLQYLADWTNSTKQGVSKNIENLINRGLIIKYEDKPTNRYIAVRKLSSTLNLVDDALNLVERPLNLVDDGVQLSLTNNIYKINNNIDNNIASECNSDIIGLCGETSNNINDKGLAEALAKRPKAKSKSKTELTVATEEVSKYFYNKCGDGLNEDKNDKKYIKNILSATSYDVDDCKKVIDNCYEKFMKTPIVYKDGRSSVEHMNFKTLFKLENFEKYLKESTKLAPKGMSTWSVGSESDKQTRLDVKF